MGAVDDYLAGLAPEDAAAIDAVYEVARDTVPDAVQGTGYGMPALTYRGKPLLSVMRARAHIGIHPFSADAVAATAGMFEGFGLSKGTIRFQPDAPPPADALRALVEARRAQIDG